MIRGYDQWKTASPYDDYPDWIDEAESWLKRNDQPMSLEEAVPVEIIRGLLEVLEDEGILKRSRWQDTPLAKAYHEGYKAGKSGWISIEDRMPDRYQYILLVNDRYWNAPDEMGGPHVAAVGYLDEIGGQQYFSIFGERGMEIESFTHWMPIPEYPVDEEQ